MATASAFPRSARSPAANSTLVGGHLAKRCVLVVMIAFGELVSRVGDVRAGAREPGGLGFAIGFVETAALWGSGERR